MTPKEKAKELVDRYYTQILLTEGDAAGNIQWVFAKQCALICVDEILSYIGNNIFFVNPNDEQYFEEVKQEIEKL